MPRGNRTDRRGRKEKLFGSSVLIRCTDEQALAWEAAADDEGHDSRADWAREKLDEAARVSRP